MIKDCSKYPDNQVYREQILSNLATNLVKEGILFKKDTNLRI